jgi:hypothetical protein
MVAGNVVADVCQDGCGGVWLDQFELQKVDNADECVGADVLAVEPAPDVVIDWMERRNCPQCHGIVMARHFFSVKMQIEIDECPKCGGVWLDQGELAKIREQFGSDEEMQEATEQHFSEVFAGDFAAMAEADKRDLQRARTFARLFRFLCPSYYLAGKQAGGAF